MVSSALLLRFALSAVVGGAGAIGAAAATARPQIVSTARAGVPVAVTDPSGAPVDFGVKAGNPQPVAPLPAEATIQLLSFHGPLESSPPTTPNQPAWLNPSAPRVPPVTQFDGGPLQAVNCVMASGAMLARLGFGIVTTGSQLRELQDDRDGGTNLANLAQALGRGWGVRFFSGSVTTLQLRALLYGGAGAVVIGNYGELPLNVRLQASFTGSHAVYVDAFRPAGPAGPAAYYVMDPIGRTWAGYKGGWWPAEDVERFATSFGGGLVNTAWSFPGGTVPKDHPVLPRDAYPPDTPRASPRPGETARPGATLEPGTSPGATPPVTADDPMPVEDTDVVHDDESGTPPPVVPKFPRVDILEDKVVVEPGFAGCLAVPRPLACPRGIVGVIDVGGPRPPRASPPPPLNINLLYANAIALGTYQIIFEPPPDTVPDLWAWDAATGGALVEATVEAGELDGRRVSVATIVLPPEADFSFVATASGDGIRALSPIGSLEVTP